MRKPLGMRLHTRLWLASVLAFAVFTLLVSWVVRQTTEPPLRAVIVRDPQGEVIGSGQARYRPADVLPDEVRAPIPGLEHVPYGKFGPGPEFIAQMDDGQILHIHMPRAARSFWTRPPNGFLWSLSLVALAMALATYPITRRLTRRLQALQQGVHAWGQGNLAVRVPEQGQDEVAFLARQFNHTARQIEGLVNSHKSLLANASHELRTPLTRIRMALELMGTQPTPAMRDQIAQSISEVDQLIDEILLASRLDSPEADLGTPERVDLVGLAAEECSRVAAQVHVLSAPEALQVNGYPRLLRRLMRNLLDNARHYGPTAGELDVELDRTSAEQLVLRINDRGPGIPSQYLDQVFSPFFRLPGSVEGGVGLGLALVRSIATRHQGRVWCENRPDGGARFVVELPIHPASAGV
ncbi:MAG: sensor histidine kinase [Betaproteobacteria bacterium]|nr:sensor histidine kinase [Betaproteobacteria bacterium]